MPSQPNSLLGSLWATLLGINTVLVGGWAISQGTAALVDGVPASPLGQLGVWLVLVGLPLVLALLAGWAVVCLMLPRPPASPYRVLLTLVVGVAFGLGAYTYAPEWLLHLHSPSAWFESSRDAVKLFFTAWVLTAVLLPRSSR